MRTPEEVPPWGRRRPRRQRPHRGGDVRGALRTAGVAAACTLALTVPASGGEGEQVQGGDRTSTPTAERGSDGPPTRRHNVPGGRRGAERQVAVPERLHIPAIGVDAPVGPLDVGSDGVLPPPSRPGAAGWWRDGPEPGEAGPAVLVGHYDSRDGPAVFHRLDALERGDRITVVRADGSRSHFTVRGSESHRQDAFPTDAVYGPTTGGRPALRLVTCGGAYDRAAGRYTENVIVFAD